MVMLKTLFHTKTQMAGYKMLQKTMIKKLTLLIKALVMKEKN